MLYGANYVGSMNSPAVVRVAASRRSFLIGLWPIAAYYLLAVPVRLLWPSDAATLVLPGWTFVLPLAVWLAYWLHNRRSAIWIERSHAGIAVRPRRWTRVGDLFTGKLRAQTPIEERFAPDAPVAFDASRIAWWRVDRTLIIDGRRYSVYPEACDNAALL